MMKRLLMVALTVMLAGTAAAQRVQMGIRAGVFSQDMDLKFSVLNTKFNTDARLGWNAALVSRVRLMAIGSGSFGMGLYLQPEIVYSQNAYRLQEPGRKVTKVSMRDIDVPVLLSFQLAIVRIQAGPVFNVMHKTPVKRGDMNVEFHRSTVGYGLGLSVDLFRGLVLDGRWNGQFKKLRNYIDRGDGVYESLKGSLSSWSVGLSWMFN